MKRTTQTAVSPLTLLWASRYEYKAVLKTHRHRICNQLFYIISGSGYFTLGGKHYPFTAGDLFIARNGIAHGLMPKGSAAVQTIEAKFDIHENRLLAALRHSSGYFHDTTSFAAQPLTMMHDEGMRRNEFYREIAVHTLSALLYRLLRSTTEDQRPAGDVNDIAFDPTVQAVIDYLDKNITSHLSLAATASATGYSTRHVSAHFKRITGMTVFDYVKHMRIAAAKQLIRTTQLPFEDIAAKTGFENVQHFNRIFKAVTGVPPGKWRSRERDGIRKDIMFEPAALTAVKGDYMKPDERTRTRKH
ncbi:MAG: helix-turn-helix domain-containing protein [Spirochaetes bacterium]|nr:helix-turn-helix domain-containing protein [Spirochaetota bacterium]